MSIFSKLSDSTDLVNGMAQRLGVDVAADIANSPDTAAKKLRQRVILCSSCSDQKGCAELQASTTHLDHAPDYCMNKHALEREAREE